MAGNFLLRAEAVNLSNFVYDTNRIQPTRGGSFMLLESVHALQGRSFGNAKLEKITTGASIGLFRFQAVNAEEAENVAQAVRAELLAKTGNHAAFVVNYVPEGSKNDDFKKDLLKLQARNRWQQYQQPTLMLPLNESDRECAYDGVRPTCKEMFLGEPVSESVSFRAESGRKLRQEIYSLILGNNQLELDFTDDLQTLSHHTEKGNLNDKIAFIYLDGNRFTKIRTNLCDTADKLTEFSNKVEEARNGFLKKLLEDASHDADFVNGKEIRLETLLWGGDELEIVVPAWKGWQVLRDFFAYMTAVAYEKAPLTHAGGIIFCNCKAPIREIRRMAHELAEMAKKEIPVDINTVNHNDHDLFHFLTLESFDTIGSSIGPFVDKYFGKETWKAMMMRGCQMSPLSEAISLMKKNSFPRNKIFDVVNKVRGGETKKNLDLFIRGSLKGNRATDEIIKGLDAFVAQEIRRWQVVCDLWDYVG